MEEKPRLKHHYLPRFYLNGFSFPEKYGFVWAYSKGEPFKPGNQNYKIFSPCLSSTRAVGTEIQLYSNHYLDGSVDFDSIEKQLEAEEKKAQPIIEKIRARGKIDESEKMELAKYIILTWKRLPVTRKGMAPLWQKTKSRIFLELREAFGVLAHRNASDPTILEKIDGMHVELDRLESEYASKSSDIRDTMLNQSMFNTSDFLIDTLSSMKWVLYVTSAQFPFLCSDNPVYFNRKLGLRRSELSFPISSGIALVATWDDGVDKFYQKASADLVRRINRNTACLVDRFVFAPIAAEWITRITNRERLSISW